MSVAYRILAPSVASEVIDGEAIIMDLRSGSYFSADGVGALVWEAIEKGASHEAILAWAAAAYPDASAKTDIEAFLEELTRRQLVGAVPAAFDVTLPMPSIPYAAPVLAVHEDMQDLLVLDPIHDVAEAGWPVRKEG